MTIWRERLLRRLAKKGRKRKKHMKKFTYFQCVILSRDTVPEQRVRRRARQQHVAGLFLSFPSRAREESKLRASLLAELIQQANDMQTSLLRPWMGPSIVCVRYKAL